MFNAIPLVMFVVIPRRLAFDVEVNIAFDGEVNIAFDCELNNKFWEFKLLFEVFLIIMLGKVTLECWAGCKRSMEAILSML